MTKLVVPTITAKDAHQFREQTELVANISEFAHLDLSSSDFFNASPSIDPSQIYFDEVLTYSVHLMFHEPLEHVKTLLSLSYPPKLIILPVEADSKNLLEAIKLIHDSPTTSLGLALLQDSKPDDYSELLKMAVQVLIFSGNLGEHGGRADLSLVSKVKLLKELKPELELAWDGGINKDNIGEISKSGIEIFYVGGSIHNTSDPASSLLELQELAEKST